jgi:hypothetical protein
MLLFLSAHFECRDQNKPPPDEPVRGAAPGLPNAESSSSYNSNNSNLDMPNDLEEGVCVLWFSAA